VRWHQGELLYEGNRRSAVFTVTLPPFGLSVFGLQATIVANLAG